MINLLPIGSVVTLKNSNKKMMIYGRKQTHVETGVEYDYVACLYPEGHIGMETTYLFNNDQIDMLYFIGYQNEEEFEIKKKLTEAYEKEDSAR